MQDIWLWFVRAMGAVGAFIAGLLGGWDATISVLMGFMVVDFITGLLVALQMKSNKSDTGGLSSKASFKGLLKKVFVLFLVGVGAALDGVLGTPGVLRLAVSMFYIANEGLSILENAALLDVPLPKALVSALEAMREKNDEPPDDEQ